MPGFKNIHSKIYLLCATTLFGSVQVTYAREIGKEIAGAIEKIKSSAVDFLASSEYSDGLEVSKRFERLKGDLDAFEAAQGGALEQAKQPGPAKAIVGAEDEEGAIAEDAVQAGIPKAINAKVAKLTAEPSETMSDDELVKAPAALPAAMPAASEVVEEEKELIATPAVDAVEDEALQAPEAPMPEEEKSPGLPLALHHHARKLRKNYA